LPGSRLSIVEKKLAERWDSSTYTAHPLLTGIQVRGNPGLRGQTDLTMEFDYPVTVLCGRNGSGKSTILALAALAFHSAGVPSGTSLQGDYYTFRDFFFKGPGDPDIAGLEITWRYRNCARAALKITKQTKQWMRYARRPARSVYYVGALRAVPAIEQTVLRHHFGGGRKLPHQPLDSTMRERLGEIMGRTYSEAEIHSSQRHALRTCKSAGTYSSFNMGAGEDVLIDLLFTLQAAPEGSLIVIEEVELGLHPAAVARLAEHLQKIALKRHLQIVVSSHSEHFVDSLPRRARVLLQCAGAGSVVIPSPTTRFAMSEMSGSCVPELYVYCEDEVAAIAVESGMDGSQRKRVRAVPVGSATQLTTVAAHMHLAAALPQRAMLVWDGDVAQSDRNRWLRDLTTAHPNHDVSWTTLPGGVPPERWVVEALDCPEGHALLAARTRCDRSTVAGWLTQLRALPEHHSIPFEFHRLANQANQELAARDLFAAAADLASSGLSAVATIVQQVLDGGLVRQAAEATVE